MLSIDDSRVADSMPQPDAPRRTSISHVATRARLPRSMNASTMRRRASADGDPVRGWRSSTETNARVTSGRSSSAAKRAARARSAESVSRPRYASAFPVCAASCRREMRTASPASSTATVGAGSCAAVSRIAPPAAAVTTRARSQAPKRRSVITGVIPALTLHAGRQCARPVFPQLENSEIPPDGSKCLERETKLLLRVSGGDDRADARLVAGHGRKADALREHAGVEQPVRQPHRQGRVTDDHGRDRTVAHPRVETEDRQALP